MSTSSKTPTAYCVAVIGCGKSHPGKEGWAIGHSHATGYQLAAPGIRLCGVDPNPENLAAFGERFGVPPEDLFTSTDALYTALTPDVVSICTWPKLHAAQVIEAARRGVRGILCEKPMALNGREIDAMLEACRKSGTLLAIAHQRCHNPHFKLAKKLLHAGAIGRDSVLEARVGEGWDMLSWSVHWIDIASWLFESTPASVMAGASHSGQRIYQHAIEDSSVVFAEYPDNRQAIFITGPAHYQKGEMVFLRGTEGMLAISDNHKKPLRIWNEAEGYREIMPLEDEPSGMHAMVLEMFAALESGASMQLDAARTAISTRTAFAAHESARLMKKIEAPFTTGYAPLEIQQHPAKPCIPEGRIVLFADEHFGSGGREGILEGLEKTTGRKPELIEASAGLTPTDLDGAGVLLLYHTQEEPSPETRGTLTNWIESGKPTVFVHAALGGYKNWPEYHQWAGKIWIWGTSEHPHEETQLLATDPRFVAWKEAWLPNDEVFIKLGSTADVEVLVETTIPQGTFPAAWILKAYPNVVSWVPGHRREMWSVPAMASGLVEMIRLASMGREFQ
jgi:predicted dehydrogenase